METTQRLQNRDYTLIIDKSASMETPDCAGGKSRWQSAQESTLAFARRINQLDPDGITVYTFAGAHKRYDNVGPEKVAQIFQENHPMGSTDLAAVLADAFNHWRLRKKKGELKSGETILVVTDGEPDDQASVANVIKEVTRHMDADEELGVAFFQIGKDSAASAFLKRLDDNLQREGAKFDIVDVKTFAELEGVTMDEALLAALDD